MPARRTPWVRRLYAYVGPTHQQPCVQDGVASLSICKPKIRRSALAGDIVARFRSPGKGAPVKLEFVGRVARIVPMDKFFGSVEYGHRRDGCLYTREGKRARETGSYDRDHWTWGGITEKHAIERDWSGKNVIIFKTFLGGRHGDVPSDLPRWALPALRARALFKDPRKRRGERVLEIVDHPLMGPGP